MSRNIAVEHEAVTEKVPPTVGGCIVPPSVGGCIVLCSGQLDRRGGKGFVIFGIGYVKLLGLWKEKHEK